MCEGLVEKEGETEGLEYASSHRQHPTVSVTNKMIASASNGGGGTFLSKP